MDCLEYYDALYELASEQVREELFGASAVLAREGAGIALTYDVGDGRVADPAVYANVNGAASFDADGFFSRVGSPRRRRSTTASCECSRKVGGNGISAFIPGVPPSP